MSKIRLLLRSVYLKGQVDANKKTSDMSWEDKIVSEIDTYYKSKEVGCEEIADKMAKELPVNYDGTNPGNYHILELLAKSLLTNYSIRRRG